jgi:D-alanyl-D-alanine dipeptidase
VRAVDTTSTFPDAGIPPVSDEARAIGFVDIRSTVPDAVIDMRYATANNFVGVQLYPVGARCLVHESMAPRLADAARVLRGQGLSLVFWDCYRPHDVQVRMFDAVANPVWVAKPGPFSRSHETGLSVDVTLAGKQPQCPTGQQVADLCLLDMGTDFDDFTPRAHADATDSVSETAQQNRATLRAAMRAGDLTGYSGEWWHFDAPGANAQRPIVNVPLT